LSFSALNISAARSWLILASTALGFSALLAILLVFSRAPVVQDVLGLKSLFHTILVLHVNFAVLVWLLSFIGSIWLLYSSNPLARLNGWALKLCVTGAVLMMFSPLLGEIKPIMSNYVPVIDSPIFFLGLFLFSLGISLLAWQTLRDRSWDLLRFSALTWFVSLLVLLYHAFQVKAAEPSVFFEALFWGAGHVLQFVYVLILWLVWRWPNPEFSKWGKQIIMLILAFAIGVTLFLDPNGLVSREAFTSLMRWGMLLLLIPMLWWWFCQPKKELDASVTASALLMMLGVIIGFLIRDDSVIVTAHYHATNAAVTVAFMGLAYRLLNEFGFRGISSKWLAAQISLYTIGMFLYVLGMASSGWLGVPRKTAMIVDDSLERVSMGIMGLGGAISIIATLIFIGLIAYAFVGHKKMVKELK